MKAHHLSNRMYTGYGCITTKLVLVLNFHFNFEYNNFEIYVLLFFD